MTQFLPKLPVATLMVAIVGVDALALGLRFASEGSPSKSNWVVGLALSQAVLIGTWAGLGNAPLVVRLPAATLATGLLIRFIVLAQEVPEFAVVMVTIDIGGLTAIVASVFAAGRLFGIRLRSIEPANAGRELETRPQRWQFSLSQLLQLVAGWSLALAILRWVFPPLTSLPHPQGHSLSTELLIFTGFFGLPMPLGVWAFLNSEKPAVRIILFVALLTLLACLFAPALGAPTAEVVVAFVAYAAIVLAALVVARLSDYRVGRQKLAPARQPLSIS